MTHLDPRKLLGHLELAFILMLNLSSYSALMVYKRLFTLFCRSSHILISASEYVEADNSDESVRRTFIELLGTLAAQLRSLPDSAFETELPEMDVFYLDELEALRNNLAAALGSWTDMEDSALREAWARPRAGAKEKWRWELEALAPRLEVEGEDEDEEGEYAPVVVEA